MKFFKIKTNSECAYFGLNTSDTISINKLSNAGKALVQIKSNRLGKAGWKISYKLSSSSLIQNSLKKNNLLKKSQPNNAKCCVFLLIF